MNTELNTKIKLNIDSSVVEYNAARKILWELKLSIRREKDHLMIFRREDNDFFYSDKPSKLNIYTLYIDEGMFSDCMIYNGELLHYCLPWMEMVDYRELLSIIFSELLPKSKHPTSDYMGRGRNQRALIDGYHKILKNNKNIEFTSGMRKEPYCE